MSGTIGTITGIAIARLVMQAYHERLQQECWPYAAVQKQWPIEAEREARRRVVEAHYLAHKVRPV